MDCLLATWLQATDAAVLGRPHAGLAADPHPAADLGSVIAATPQHPHGGEACRLSTRRSHATSLPLFGKSTLVLASLCRQTWTLPDSQQSVSPLVGREGGLWVVKVMHVRCFCSFAIASRRMAQGPAELPVGQFSTTHSPSHKHLRASLHSLSSWPGIWRVVLACSFAGVHVL